MPCKRKKVNVIHCRICGRAIKGYSFATRMAKLRRHYKRVHYSTWRKSVKKGARKRKRRY